MKVGVAIAGLALAFTGVTGCGGEDGAPTDASVEEFCGSFTTFAQDFAELGADAEDTALMGLVQDFADEMVETGTPEDIPDDARAGFELTMEAVQDLGDDATAEDFLTLEEEFSDADQENADAFDAYLEETCNP